VFSLQPEVTKALDFHDPWTRIDKLTSGLNARKFASTLTMTGQCLDFKSKCIACYIDLSFMGTWVQFVLLVVELVGMQPTAAAFFGIER
jgi:hypothetical protein